MDETTSVQRCTQIFREIIGRQYPELLSDWSNERLLREPVGALNIDSLTRLEFIMQVENACNVELDEAAVNACRTLREIAALVTAASK